MILIEKTSIIIVYDIKEDCMSTTKKFVVAITILCIAIALMVVSLVVVLTDTQSNLNADVGYLMTLMVS